MKIIGLICCMLSICAQRATVTKMIFSNHTDLRTAKLDFNQKIIIENIFLVKKVKNDLAVTNASLIDDIVLPKEYSEKVDRAMATKNFDSANYKDAMTDQITLDLSNLKLDEKDVYSLRIKPLGSNYSIYTSTFVYDDGDIKYEEEKKGLRWYANPWVWSSIVFIVLILLFLIKLFCY